MPKVDYLIGQKDLKVSLEASIKNLSGNVFLFFGPKGIGKHSFAVEFAMGILCKEEKTFGGCKKCVSCKYIQSGSHPDYKEILLGENDKTIKTDVVRRTLCADVFLLPQISKKKVYYIQGDYLNEQSQNAILKTLEEIPDYATVIISTTSLQTLLPTLISRSVTIYFQRNTKEEIIEILRRNIELDDDLILFYAKMADGIPGAALDLSSEEYIKDTRQEIFDILFSIPDKEVSDLLLNNYSIFENNKNNIDEIIVIINSWIRDLIVMSVSKNKTKLINEDQYERMVKFTEYNNITKTKLYEAFRIVFSASKGLKLNAGFEHCISNMLVQLRKELSNA